MEVYKFFLDILFRADSRQRYFDSVLNTFTGETVYEEAANPEEAPMRQGATFVDVPDYLSPRYTGGDNSLRILKVPLYEGYLVDLTRFGDVEDYLRNHVGKARYSQLRRYKKRLDLCISPRYVAYYGEMDEREYRFVFECLREFTEKRFRQKEEINYELPFLAYYEEVMYRMILEKKALLFVIYDGKKPINITLNFIFGDLMLHWNSCFDIDYGVFNVGHINTMEHFRWCFKNNICVFDMGRGNFWHKQRLINHTYRYQQHIVCKRTFLSVSRAVLYAARPYLRYYLIRGLKKVNAQKLYGYYAKYRFRSRQRDGHSPAVSESTEYTWSDAAGAVPPTECLRAVFPGEEGYARLRGPFNQFLHREKISQTGVQVFEQAGSEDSFIIRTPDKTLQLTFNQKIA